MKRLYIILFTSVVMVSLAASPNAAGLTLVNGDFDLDPDLGGADDAVAPPTGWFVHYDIPQSWSDFRFGNDGNGGWDNNAIAFGQNYLGPFYEPGPEDGYYYTSLGRYADEISAVIDGFGYNRINRNEAGGFGVGLYYSPGGVFMGANGTDVAASTVLLGSMFVDISTLTGSTPESQAFSFPVAFAGSGINPGDEVWLRFGDGPDDGNLSAFDEPMIDNLTLTTVIPEPSSLALLLMGGGVATIAVLRRRRMA